MVRYKKYKIEIVEDKRYGTGYFYRIKEVYWQGSKRADSVGGPYPSVKIALKEAKISLDYLLRKPLPDSIIRRS